MVKKRKSDASRLDEVDRSMYASFSGAANSLSQLYTQSMNQQRLSFQAGERHSLEKLYSWILRQREDGSRVNSDDIVTYLQNELEYGLEESSPMSPRLPFQHQHHSQSAMQLPNTGFPVSCHSDHQSKNSVFSNAFSGPVCWSLQQQQQQQPFSLGGFHSSNVMMPTVNGARINETTACPPHQIRDSNTPSLNDSLMDMNADSPARDSSY